MREEKKPTTRAEELLDRKRVFLVRGTSQIRHRNRQNFRDSPCFEPRSRGANSGVQHRMHQDDEDPVD